MRWTVMERSQTWELRFVDWGREGTGQEVEFFGAMGDGWRKRNVQCK